MGKTLTILTERFIYSARTSVGKIFMQYIKDYVQSPLVLSKDYFCYSLEDTCRPGNVKVFGETALPDGLICDVSLFENAHYGKTLILHTEKDGRTIKFGNLSWADCLFHNGLNFNHTEACVLVGSDLSLPKYDTKTNLIITEPMIYNGMKDQLRTFIEKKINEGYDIKAQFVNKNFNNS